jgi:(S)-citramalyl-CoA lyase
MGFVGKFVIHPYHVGRVRSAFAPSPKELEWARRVLTAAQQGPAVFVVDGEMVDAPILSRAKRILDLAGELGTGLPHGDDNDV